MRYMLLIVGLLAFAFGLVDDGANAIWAVVGAILFGFGASTLDIVAALKAGSDQAAYVERMHQFDNAARRGDKKAIAELLESRGVDEDIALSVAEDAAKEHLHSA